MPINLNDIWNWLTGAPPAPAAAVGESMTVDAKTVANIAHFIMDNNKAFFSTVSGGTINKISIDTALAEAPLIIQYSTADLTPALFVSWIIGESLGDPRAYNPNLQHFNMGKIMTGVMCADNEDPAEAFLHTDWGIGQLDGKNLVAKPDLQGMHWEDQRDSAFDMTWSIPVMSETCVSLLTWASGVHHSYKAVNAKVIPWGNDYRVLAGTAYNKGRTGATTPGVSYAYGEALVARSLLAIKAGVPG